MQLLASRAFHLLTVHADEALEALVTEDVVAWQHAEFELRRDEVEVLQANVTLHLLSRLFLRWV